jgi:hypothetical protein
MAKRDYLYKQCQCCGEFKVPEDECEDYCDSCKYKVQLRLYDFLKENFTEKEIDCLDEMVNESFYCFMERYKENENV